MAWPPRTRSVIQQEPTNGHVFCFLNRSRNRIKLLIWDRTGYLIVYKRLSAARSPSPPSPRQGRVMSKWMRVSSRSCSKGLIFAAQCGARVATAAGA